MSNVFYNKYNNNLISLIKNKNISDDDARNLLDSLDNSIRAILGTDYSFVADGGMCEQKCRATHPFELERDPEQNNYSEESSVLNEFLKSVNPQSVQCLERKVRKYLPSDFDRFDPAKVQFLMNDYCGDESCKSSYYPAFNNAGNHVNILNIEKPSDYSTIAGAFYCCNMMEYYNEVATVSMLTGLSPRLFAENEIALQTIVENFYTIKKLGDYLSPTELGSLVLTEISEEIRSKSYSTPQLNYYLRDALENIDVLLAIKDVLLKTDEGEKRWFEILNKPISFQNYSEADKEGFVRLLNGMADAVALFGQNRKYEDGVIRKYSGNFVFLQILETFYKTEGVDPALTRKNSKAFFEFTFKNLSEIKTEKGLDSFFRSLENMSKLAGRIDDFSKFVSLMKNFENLTYEFAKDPYSVTIPNRNYLNAVEDFSYGISENPALLNKYYENFSSLVLEFKWKFIKDERTRYFIAYISDRLVGSNLDVLRKIIAVYPRFSYIMDIALYLQSIKSLYPFFNIIGKLKKAFDENSSAEVRMRLFFFDYLVLIGTPESEILGFLEREKNGITQYYDLFLKDRRDGYDLTVFSYNKMEVYVALFEALRRGLKTSLESLIAEAISFDKLIAEEQDFSKILRISNEISNTISPKLGERLYNQAYESLYLPGGLAKMIRNHYNPKTGKIDVTQNNIRDINAILTFLQKLKENNKQLNMDSELPAVFGDYKPLGNFFDALRWLSRKFDVEEINFSAIKGVDLFSEYISLIANIEAIQNVPASKYLTNMLMGMDPNSILSGNLNGILSSVTSIDLIEKLRTEVNKRNKNLGDKLVDGIGSGYLVSNPVSFKNILSVMEFGKAWDVGQGRVGVDVEGLYKQYSIYAFDLVAGFVSQVLEKNGNDISKAEAIFKENGLDFDSILGELSARGFELRREGKISKGMKRIFTNTSYTLRRLRETKDEIIIDVNSLQIKDSKWPARNGVAVKEVWANGKEMAKVFKFNRSHVGVQVHANRDGIVKTQEIVNGLGEKYIFSAPLTMTTGAHKMTEMVFVGGEQISFLWTPNSKDGMLFVDKDGNPKIIDKRQIRISDLISASDLENSLVKSEIIKWLARKNLPTSNVEAVLKEEIRPSENLWDKMLLLSLISVKGYSMLSNILVVNGEEVQRLHDENTDRRFFVEFEDGSFGVIDSTENMSTGNLADIVVALHAKRAVYMDTGMYDIATYRDGEGKDHIVGHVDTDESTNRIVIYMK